MNVLKRARGYVGGMIWLALASGALMGPLSAKASEEKYDVLQVGTHTYTNVTITTKAKGYVFILHSAGMTNVKISELPPEVQQTLGYAPLPGAVKVETNSPAAAWAKQTMAKFDSPKLKEMQSNLSKQLPALMLKLPKVPVLSRNMLIAAGAVLFFCYLFACYCWMRICKKAGGEPGVLVWLPVLQVFPILSAARMSPLWFVTFLVPIIPHVVWSIKIARVCGRSGWLSLWLILPITYPLAFLYLAFSGSSEPKIKTKRVVEIMSLEAA
jgi:hypothetical protein